MKAVKSNLIKKFYQYSKENYLDGVIDKITFGIRESILYIQNILMPLILCGVFCFFAYFRKFQYLMLFNDLMPSERLAMTSPKLI